MGPLRASSVLLASRSLSRPLRPSRASPIFLPSVPSLRTSHTSYPPLSLRLRLVSACRTIHTSRPPSPPRRWPTNLLILALISALPLYLLTSHILPSHPATLDRTDFHSYTLISKHPLSPTLSIFVLRPSFPVLNTPVPSLPPGIHSVELKNPLLQISRHYTPLPLPSSLSSFSAEQSGNPRDIHLLIRHAPKGEVSTYFHRLPVSFTIELRGPRVEYALSSAGTADVTDVLFIAGGTGIAPALQVAHQLADGPAQVGVLWATRLRDEARGGVNSPPTEERQVGWGTWVWRGATKGASGEDQRGAIRERTAGGEKSPLVELIDGIGALKGDREGEQGLRVEYFVDEEGSFIGMRDVARWLRAGEAAGKQGRNVNGGRKVVFVSGPDGFVDYILGPRPPGSRGQLGGEEAGRVERPGGVLGQLDTGGWEVVRL